MKEKIKANKKLIIVIIILSVLLIASLGFITYEVFIKNEKEDIEENSEVIDKETIKEETEENSEIINNSEIYIDKNAIDYCLNNINTIYESWKEYELNSFIYKYYPEDFKTPTENDIDCNSAIINEKDSDYLYIRSDFYGLVSYNIKTNEIQDCGDIWCYSDDYDYSQNFTIPFVYAKNMINDDVNSYMISIGEGDKVTVGTYPSDSLSSDGTFDIEIREYLGESNKTGKLYLTYTIDFNTKTFTRVVN